jgi:hypothetical protein
MEEAAPKRHALLHQGPPEVLDMRRLREVVYSILIKKAHACSVG